MHSYRDFYLLIFIDSLCFLPGCSFSRNNTWDISLNWSCPKRPTDRQRCGGLYFVHQCLSGSSVEAWCWLWLLQPFIGLLLGCRARPIANVLDLWEWFGRMSWIDLEGHGFPPSHEFRHLLTFADALIQSYSLMRWCDAVRFGNASYRMAAPNWISRSRETRWSTWWMAGSSRKSLNWTLRWRRHGEKNHGWLRTAGLQQRFYVDMYIMIYRLIMADYIMN